MTLDCQSTSQYFAPLLSLNISLYEDGILRVNIDECGFERFRLASLNNIISDELRLDSIKEKITEVENALVIETLGEDYESSYQYVL